MRTAMKVWIEKKKSKKMSKLQMVLASKFGEHTYSDNTI